MLQKILSIVLIVGLVFIWSACQDTTTEPTKTKLQSVTSIKAFSVSNTSVGLKWTKSTDESKADFLNYYLKAKNPDGTTTKELTITKGTDSVIVTSLTNGIIYTFEVISKVTTSSTNYIDSDPATIKWSPAWRFDTEGQIPIQVYERTSPVGYASGLIFYYLQTGQPKTVSLLSADSSHIDVFVDSKGASNVALSSSHLYRSNRKITRFSNFYRNSETLNNPQDAPPDTTTYTSFEFLVDSVATTSSRIYYFKGVNGNYGRILVIRNPSNGTLIWGSSPEQYLKLKLSYQSVAYNPYSKKSY
ncbi:MAG: fibronectin type III domain-containing protein [Bacteroidetes bacterium]|nr:fibronectin type III domain-containing protein [Bacteroidota bacterium]MBU1423865.1 fibronectin type III domain-containing protein [Bacteroidota bacterium]MBU2471120.1 fibronectin type III domain-containing protein [Bacteroidota bacterium]MBU2635902.1 fibronectin type III domain-containing protein [Bacteroidota bacterium]